MKTINMRTIAEKLNDCNGRIFNQEELNQMVEDYNAELRVSLDNSEPTSIMISLCEAITGEQYETLTNKELIRILTSEF